MPNNIRLARFPLAGVPWRGEGAPQGRVGIRHARFKPGSFTDPRTHGPHRALDIFANEGTPILSPVYGLVIDARVTKGRGGTLVRIAAKSRSFEAEYYFAHLRELLIDKGQVVEPGDLLGRVGTTGRNPDKPPGYKKYPHLHFQIKERPIGAKAWTYVDPYPAIRALARRVGDDPADHMPLNNDLSPQHLAALVHVLRTA